MEKIRNKDLSKILTIKDLEIEANKALPQATLQYYNEGAGDMSTYVPNDTIKVHPKKTEYSPIDLSLRENTAAYSRYQLRPRVLRNVAQVDMSTDIFGIKVPTPLGFAPTAAHKLAHPEGEIATSRAAARNGLPMCLSTWSTTALEDVIAQQLGNPYAMQVSFFKDHSITERIIKRAEKAGYKALFVSVDLPVLGNRINETRNNFSFPPHLTFPNIQDGHADLMGVYGAGYDPTINWKDTIAWLRKATKMEIWLKGIVSADDAQLAIDHGLDGVVVSNHGGRQLDGQPSTLDVLREIGSIVRGKIPLIVDGGIRRGSDIFKAIALGANMCFAGRIPIWGLAHDGEAGVNRTIEILLQELRHTMMLMGYVILCLLSVLALQLYYWPITDTQRSCRTVSDITPQHVSFFDKGILAKL